MDIAFSLNTVPIRLTEERWFHIVENHDDLAGYYDDVLSVVETHELILPGHKGTLIAVRNYGNDRYLAVIYRELSVDDGFIITAYFTSKIDRKKAIWQQT